MMSHQSDMPVVKRIARVLAGWHLSRNGEGEGASVSSQVDAEWRDYVDDAITVLRTLRKPDTAMAEAGNADIWDAMVRVAISDNS